MAHGSTSATRGEIASVFLPPVFTSALAADADADAAADDEAEGASLVVAGLFLPLAFLTTAGAAIHEGEVEAVASKHVATTTTGERTYRPQEALLQQLAHVAKSTSSRTHTAAADDDDNETEVSEGESPSPSSSSWLLL